MHGQHCQAIHVSVLVDYKPIVSVCVNSPCFIDTLVEGAISCTLLVHYTSLEIQLTANSTHTHIHTHTHTHTHQHTVQLHRSTQHNKLQTNATCHASNKY